MREWTPEEANLLQDRPSLAVCCSVSLHQKFCMRLVLVSFTINLQLHVHYSRSSEEPKPPVLGTRGRSHDVSVYETCACAIINLLS